MDFDPPACVDLHIHSSASDGTYAPPEILKLAQSLQLGAIAITDHDTLDGSREALAAGVPPSMGFITGVEISAERPSFFPGKGSCHILGYRVNLDDHNLNQTLARLQNARKDRNPRILKRLKSLGFDLTMDDIQQAAGPNGQIGRPHFAQVMLNKGYVRTFNAAFDDYLATGKPAYVDKYRVACPQAIALIRAAGGIPVLAHPALLGTPGGRLEDSVVRALKEMGLIGIEAYYTEHTPAQQNHYLDIARRHGLLVTGGSDFHGEFKPRTQMGRGRGKLRVPIDLYHALNNYA